MVGRPRKYANPTARNQAYLERLRGARGLLKDLMVEVQTRRAEVPEWLDGFVQLQVLPVILTERWRGPMVMEDYLTQVGEKEEYREAAERLMGSLPRGALKQELPLWCYTEDLELDDGVIWEGYLRGVRES